MAEAKRKEEEVVLENCTYKVSIKPWMYEKSKFGAENVRQYFEKNENFQILKIMSEHGYQPVVSGNADVLLTLQVHDANNIFGANDKLLSTGGFVGDITRTDNGETLESFRGFLAEKARDWDKAERKLNSAFPKKVAKEMRSIRKCRKASK